jgi:hypothetical protein
MSIHDSSSENFSQWQPPDKDHSARAGEIHWRALNFGTWMKFGSLYFLKMLTALAWAMSFQTINPILGSVFLADILPFPLPSGLEDMSASILVNVALGILAVLLPTVLWHFALKYNVLRNPRAYFEGNPLRVLVCCLLTAAYVMTITLEMLSLINRVHDAIDQGPIPTLGNQPDLLPLILASSALIIGSCLLGLASASLNRSIHVRYGT